MSERDTRARITRGTFTRPRMRAETTGGEMSERDRVIKEGRKERNTEEKKDRLSKINQDSNLLFPT